jgi:hypothetical protein
MIPKRRVPILTSLSVDIPAYDIDKEAVQKWIDEAASKSLHDAREAFSSTVTYISYKLWKQELKKSIQNFLNYIKERYSACNIRIFNTQTIKEIKESVSEEIQDLIREELEVSPNKSVTYFQFKMPDSKSIPEGLMAEGNFVRGCNGRLGCPDAFYYRFIG